MNKGKLFTVSVILGVVMLIPLIALAQRGMRGGFGSTSTQSSFTPKNEAEKKIYGVLKDPIDLLFLDADKDGYHDYLKQLLPLVRPGGLIVAHNMEQGGTQSYISAVTNNADLETLFINTGSGSVGVTMKKH